MIKYKEIFFAWCIHLFTALGSICAVFAMLAVHQGDVSKMMSIITIALIIDGLDGPLARKFKVKEVLPRWSGSTLDLVIDYLTYVFVPATSLLLIPNSYDNTWLMYLVVSLIVLSGAIYFIDQEMKLVGGSFRGFPGAWIFVILYYYIFMPNIYLLFAFTVFFSILSFSPIKIIHPFRTSFLRSITHIILAFWVIVAAIIVLYYRFDHVPLLLKISMLIAPIYIGVLSIYLGRVTKNDIEN